MDYADPTRADALAAAYVTGTLRGPARRRFDALLGAHPALREAVAQWQARLMPLTGAVEPVEPPPQVWDALQRRLWPQADAPAAVARADGARWWQRLAAWRAATVLAGTATLVLAALLANPRAVPAPVVVVLQGTGDGGVSPAVSVVASLSGDGRSAVARPLQPVALPAGRVLELWSVPPEGAPRSLGLIGASGTTVLAPDRLPATLLRGGTAALAVSVEPPGGSPTGAPTGPVVFAGRLAL